MTNSGARGSLGHTGQQRPSLPRPGPTANSSLSTVKPFKFKSHELQHRPCVVTQSYHKSTIRYLVHLAGIIHTVRLLRFSMVPTYLGPVATGAKIIVPIFEMFDCFA